jgi:hypothetical protein
MTDEQIIEMAKQDGLYGLVEGGIINKFKAFAELVAKNEREACAKLCERDDSMRWSGAAQAIRARGET